MARVVNSILTLFRQINEIAPNRSKASDGTEGDPRHQLDPTSDHNPHTYPQLGTVICAGDYTHDPAHGADMGEISESIRQSRDPRCKYLIFNERITGPNHDWEWDDYDGDNDHKEHMHVSAVSTFLADYASEWSIGDVVSQDLINTINIMSQRLTVLYYDMPANIWAAGLMHNEPNQLRARVVAVQADVTAQRVTLGAVFDMLNTITSDGTTVDTAAILERMDRLAAAEVEREVERAQALADALLTAVAQQQLAAPNT